MRLCLKKYLWFFPSSEDNVEEKPPDQKIKARMQPAKPSMDVCRGSRHREQENKSCWAKPCYIDRLEEHVLNMRDTDEEKAFRYRHHRVQADRHCRRECERASGTYSHRGSTAALGPKRQAVDVKVRPGVIYREVLPHSRPRVIRLDSTPPVGHPDSRPPTARCQSPSVAEHCASATSPRPHPYSKPSGLINDSTLPVNQNQFQYPESLEMVSNPSPVFRPQTPGPIDQGSRPQSQSNNMGLDDPAQYDLSQSLISAPPVSPDIQDDAVGPNPLLHTSCSRRFHTTNYHNNQSSEKPSQIIPDYLSPPRPEEHLQSSRDQQRPALLTQDSQTPSPKCTYSQSSWVLLSQNQDNIEHSTSPLSASHDPHSGRVVYDARALHSHAREPAEVKEMEEEQDKSQVTHVKSAQTEEKATGCEGACTRRRSNLYRGTKPTFNLPPLINTNRYRFQMPEARMSKNPRAQTQKTDYCKPQNSTFNHSVQ
ncbi:uncharacterized protein LOC115457493 [Microcaecilia unicolor]|uniref:Uncharacterized protein LOC115457493 n=1 Tax=Microcaecilia unicolor TaxID=1415580 RepID=A0A6P7WQY5_9AMPH|nr:uncharacterized protein LOC115457493 [Microcaecilia unicolor]